jgi:hypothetical protein
VEKESVFRFTTNVTKFFSHVPAAEPENGRDRPSKNSACRRQLGQGWRGGHNGHTFRKQQTAIEPQPRGPTALQLHRHEGNNCKHVHLPQTSPCFQEKNFQCCNEALMGLICRVKHFTRAARTEPGVGDHAPRPVDPFCFSDCLEPSTSVRAFPALQTHGLRQYMTVPRYLPAFLAERRHIARRCVWCPPHTKMRGKEAHPKSRGTAHDSASSVVSGPQGRGDGGRTGRGSGRRRRERGSRDTGHTPSRGWI